MKRSDFYLVPEDLFRLGNAENPRLSHVRQRDVDVIQVGEIAVVVANGKGSTCSISRESPSLR